jgi:hypothetical protein
MKNIVDLEELGFDVSFMKHDTHPHRFTCDIRRWDQNRETFIVKSFQWITDNGVSYIKPSDRLKKFFIEKFGDIEKITDLKINWEKYDSDPRFT